MVFLGFWCALLANSISQAELPVVRLQALCAEIAEDSSVTNAFLVSRTGPVEQALTVYYGVSGSAKNGQDYRWLPGQVTIPAGASSAIIQLAPIDNGIVEGPESVVLTLVSNVQPFTIVALPDSQYYVAQMCAGQPAMFDRQTQWIVDHKDERNIAFVLHEGDLIEHDVVLAEWQRAQHGMSLLDGVVPYALTVGNHELMTSNQTVHLNQFFPVTNFQALPTFGGVFEPNRIDNTFHLFSAGGLDWLVLSIEFGPRDEVLAWANDVVTNHPNHRVILLTHAYIYYDNTLHGSLPTHKWVPSWYGRTNSGTNIWDKLVRHHPNIAFVFCGHVCDSGVGRLVSTGDWGNNVYQMLADYQFYPYGGGGFMRIIQIDPVQDKFSVETYSPYLRLNKTEPENQFAYDNIGLSESVKLSYAVDSSQATAQVTLDDVDVDLSPPALVSVGACGQPYQITVVFNEPVEKNSAENVRHYSLSGGITITNAVLQPDRATVILTTATPLIPDTPYTLSLTLIADCAPQPNLLTSNLQATFQLTSLLLTDNFEKDEMGPWTVVDQGVLDGPSLWRLASGHLAQFSNIRGPTSNAIYGRLGTFVYWNTPQAFQWSNYEFSAVLNSRVDGIGVLFRYQNPSNYYKVELDARCYYHLLTRMLNGKETVLCWERGSYSWGQDVRVRVQADGPRLFITLNGSPLFGGAITNNSLGAGTVALYTWSNPFATFDDVQVKQINHAPSVGFTSPADGSIFMDQTNLMLCLQASDADGNLQQIDLYAGDTLLGSSSVSPFIFIWSNAPPDIYTFTAVARDLWLTTTSAPITISSFRSGILPSITVPPQDTAVSQGDDASFSAAADGPGLLLYQWRRGNTPIPGATNAILGLTNVQLFQDGDYTVAVRNQSGIVYSPPAHLAVFPNRPDSIDSIQSSPSGWVRLEYDHLPAPAYVLEVSSNLVDWAFYTFVNNTNGILRYLDSSARNRPRRFYRLVAWPTTP